MPFCNLSPKRSSSDGVEIQTGAVVAGSLLSALVQKQSAVMSSHSPPASKGNDSKRFKRDGRSTEGSSRVIHIYRLPSGVTEREVLSLALPFGKVSNLLFLKEKNQAFMEMNTEEAANTMVSYYTCVTPELHGQPVHIQLSCYKELKAGASGQVGAQPGLPAESSDQAGNVGSASAAAAVDTGRVVARRTPVLRILVENCFCLVTLEVLHRLFSRFGTVLKIITYIKNNRFQVLLQYADPLSAQRAKLFLDGQNIYDACCTLRITFSGFTNLTVKYNNDKSRDYTRPDLPSGNSQALLAQNRATALGAPVAISASSCASTGWPHTFAVPQAAVAVAAAAAAGAESQVITSDNMWVCSAWSQTETGTTWAPAGGPGFARTLEARWFP
uniref:RRM domain-containing protein n=1 Tax=Peromyscus maniculatus bairdii TaxID=230844 RepID=A0A8C8W3Q3_PERMB